MKQTFTPHSNPPNIRGDNRPSTSKKNRINEEIRAPQLRVVDQDGKFIGILSRKEALIMAEQQELDLVEIAPQATPPVAKIIDFGKFNYELQKREKQQRKQQAHQQMKEIRFRGRTATHDFNFKTRHARDFILEGNKVKATVIFRGREIIHQDIGRDLLERFVEALQDIAKVDSEIKAEGKALSVVMAPDKTKKPVPKKAASED